MTSLSESLVRPASEMTFEKLAGMRVPLKSWAVSVEDGAMDQARNLARLPFALSHVALMPDAHQGYGMPIGGVLFTDRVVVPYAVGVDIGCGVSLVALNIDADDATPELVKTFLDSVALRVPVGNGPGGQVTFDRPIRMFEPRDVGKARGVTIPAHLDTILADAVRQLGTLGGGNHFVELQAGDDGSAYVMLHSGSRSVGKKICDHHQKIAAAMMKRWHVELPDKDLAWLPIETDEGKAYWNDMTVALDWAEQNRAEMARQVVGAASDVFGAVAEPVLDVHHNYATWENHFNKNGIVHRKGAVRARDGEQVLVPGSMGTASYLAMGLGNEQSFSTCQHGAGRTMSRAAAARAMAGRDLEADLGETILVTPDRRGVVDEAPLAYKDIEAVMAASADLVRPIMRLRPLGVLKG